MPRPGNAGVDVGSKPLRLLVDSTGLKLCGKGEWLLEKHGTTTRRSWRMLHLDGRRATEVAVAGHAFNRMLELGHPNYVRVA